MKRHDVATMAEIFDEVLNEALPEIYEKFLAQLKAEMGEMPEGTQIQLLPKGITNVPKGKALRRGGLRTEYCVSRDVFIVCDYWTDEHE